MPELHGRLAFITTPEFRKSRAAEVDDFVYRQLYLLCRYFQVISTGRTYDFVSKLLRRDLDEVDRGAIAEATGFSIETEEDLRRWRETIFEGMQRGGESISGMIQVTFDLVEGRIDGVIHLTDAADVTGKRDSMVLRRQANVHGAFMASEIETARAAVASWTSRIIKDPHARLFPQRQNVGLPLAGLTEGSRVLALVAHDRMKLEICRFVVENVRAIFENHDFILSTGTTGGWVRQFAKAAGRSRSEVEEKVRLCQSGPNGGDVQIAAAMLRGLCKKVIFLQDPFTSHPHETDIRLFEEAALFFRHAATSAGVKVALATNLETARVLIEAN